MKQQEQISLYQEWNVKASGDDYENQTVDSLKNILLKNRGVKPSDSQEFFNPKSPFDLTLKNIEINESKMQKAVNRIIHAIKNKEKIIVYGDYDADGITATAILWEALYNLKANVLPYIPDRFTDGYGLNYDAVSKLKKKYPDLSLIVTVDNGIVANDACEKIIADGIDIVISDHHQQGKSIPQAYAVVHTTKITGAGISWFLAREIYKKLNEDKKSLQKSLDLAAIGTIADIATLVDANRSIAKFGLEELNKLERQGLAGLANTIGLSSGDIRAYTVGYVLAPRLNAMGRLDEALESLRLLCSSNRRRIQQLAYKLNSTNVNRQKILNEVVDHAITNLESVHRLNSIVLAHESYHEGVIGLAASKLVEKYYLPAIVLSKGEEFSKASARSISGFNIIEAIRKLDHLIEGGGGHPMAAGFTIKTDKIDDFITEFEKIAREQITDEIRRKKLNLDAEIEFNLITPEVFSLITQFEPTGSGNPSPSFITRKVLIRDLRTVGKNNSHLKLIVEKDNIILEAIAFGFGHVAQNIKKGDTIDVAYNIDKNQWNGNTTLQLKLKDIKIH